jgi:hypothetical protein
LEGVSIASEVVLCGCILTRNSGLPQGNRLIE